MFFSVIPVGIIILVDTDFQFFSLSRVQVIQFIALAAAQVPRILLFFPMVSISQIFISFQLRQIL